MRGESIAPGPVTLTALMDNLCSNLLLVNPLSPTTVTFCPQNLAPGEDEEKFLPFTIELDAVQAGNNLNIADGRERKTEGVRHPIPAIAILPLSRLSPRSIFPKRSTKMTLLPAL